ncbi:hypothetical protein GH714_013888 [Hevea brasiliensis]|uniref:K-box domain-containing protein n=1 Tax=Hevea brasiliensis TaxID=3981 RepID=A0A6A6L7K0_HEVBR|nr:hypothetical protein GH714_013888 [Hevea brasiliensis]
MKTTGGSLQPDLSKETQPLDAIEEINMLKKEIEILQKGVRYLLGGRSEEMTMDELLILEKNLEIWICHIRSTKLMVQDGNTVQRDPAAEEQG